MSERLGTILPALLQDIKRRCEQNPENKDFQPTAEGYTSKVMSAVKGLGSMHLTHKYNLSLFTGFAYDLGLCGNGLKRLGIRSGL